MARRQQRPSSALNNGINVALGVAAAAAARSALGVSGVALWRISVSWQLN